MKSDYIQVIYDIPTQVGLLAYSFFETRGISLKDSTVSFTFTNDSQDGIDW